MKLQLAPYLSNEIDHLLNWVSSAKALRQWAGPSLFTWPLTLQQLSAYVIRAQNSPNIRIYKVINDDQALVGHIEFDRIDWSHRTAVLSRVIIAPGFRGKGLGHELMKVALSQACNVLHLTEVTLSVYHFNTAAIQCYRAAGFEVDAKIKDPDDTTGEWETVIMKINFD